MTTTKMRMMMRRLDCEVLGTPHIEVSSPCEVRNCSHSALCRLGRIVLEGRSRIAEGVTLSMIVDRNRIGNEIMGWR